MDFAYVLVFMAFAVVMVLGGLGLSRLVAPHAPGGAKNDTYECGEKTIGTSWIQFNVGFYLFGLMFLVFDVEAAFLYPWAVVLREFGVTGLWEAGLFGIVLMVGLLYAWKKGALEWV